MTRASRHRAVIRSLTLVLLIAAAGGLAMADEGEARLRELVADLPDQFHGWRRAPAEFYTPDSLYRYINGGAELYIAYQIVAAVSQPYLDEDGDEVRLDVFDMGSAPSAFGVFCHSRESVDRFVAPDVESEYASGLLHFWKGRFYASALAYPETETRQALLRELSRRVASRIEAADRPDLVALLPEDDLVPHSVRYFRHSAWVNDYYRFSGDNLLNIDAGVEVAMARVRAAAAEDAPAVLLIARYPGTAEAEAARRRFADALLADGEDGLGQDAQGGWLGCRREADLVIVVAAASDRQSADHLLRACARRHAQEPPREAR
jgi:hypothetical protein